MTMRICPTCGQLWPHHDKQAHRRTAMRALLSGQGYAERSGQTLASGAVIARHLPAGATWERKEPARAAELAGDVAVPFLQSSVTAMVGGITGLLIAGPVAGLVTAGLSFSGAWLALLMDHRRALWSIERITGVDLDGDGRAGAPDAPQAPTRHVRVELVENNGRQAHIQYVDLPDGVNDLDTLTDVAKALLVEGVNFSRDGLSGVLSQTEYNRLAPALVKVGLARRLPGKKRELTGAGRAMFRELLADEQ